VRVRAGWSDPPRPHRSPTRASARRRSSEYRRHGFGDDVLVSLTAAEATDRLAATDVLGALHYARRTGPARRLARGLAGAVERLGATIVEHTAALDIVAARRQPARVFTDCGTVRADVVVRATEAYTRDLPGMRRALVPLYSLMVATEPLDAATWESIGLRRFETFSDDRRMVIYGQRTTDDRIAFGGRGAPYRSAPASTGRPSRARRSTIGSSRRSSSCSRRSRESRSPTAGVACSGCRATGVRRSGSIARPASPGPVATSARASPRRISPGARSPTSCCAPIRHLVGPAVGAAPVAELGTRAAAVGGDQRRTPARGVDRLAGILAGGRHVLLLFSTGSCDDAAMSADNLSHVWFKVTDLEVASGEGSWVTTTDGDRYLDFSGGIAVTSTGHSHPGCGGDRRAGATVRARPGQRLHPRSPAAPRRTLAEISPEGIDTFFYANSGAEITEAAVKLAKQATGRPNIIVFQGSFHGRTHQAMAMTTSKTVYRAGHAPLPSGIFIAPYPDVRSRRPPGRDRPGPRRIRRTAQQRDGARRDRCGDHRAGARRGRVHRGAGRRSSRRSTGDARTTGCCSSPTRCSRASGAPARCSPSSTTTCSRTSCAWPRGSPRGSRSRRSAPAASSTTAGRPVRTVGPTAATRWGARRRWRRSRC
jgi:hypothetical protein